MKRTKLNWGIWFLFAATAVAQQASPGSDQLAVLEGIVVNALTKEPIKKAHVSLELSAGTQRSALVATTEDAGRFRFADVSAGRYKLTAEKTGFINGSYGANKPEGEGSLLTVSAGDRMQELPLRLFPGASVSGRVLDQDGDPMSDKTVAILMRAQVHGKMKNSRADSTTTNRSGEYRFDGLSPGTYYLSVSAEDWGFVTRRIPVDSSGKATKLHDLATFYPTALSLVEAQGVNVEIGQEQPGIDIRIQRGPTLSVKGRIPGTGSPPSKLSLSASVEEGIGWTSRPVRFCRMVTSCSRVYHRESIA